MHPKKPHVALFMHDRGSFAGVIVLMPSGVVFSNQTGGTMCAQPDAEGVFVPIPYVSQFPDALTDEWNPDWQRYSPVRIQQCIDLMGLMKCFEPVPESDQALEGLRDLQGWGEAWIPVKIKKLTEHTENYELLKDFADHYGIITYPNSD